METHSDVDEVNKAIVFSELSPIPTAFKVSGYHEEFVAFLGVVAPLSVMLNIFSAWVGIFPSPAVKEALGNKIINALRSNALGTKRSEQWRNTLRIDSDKVDPVNIFGRINTIVNSAAQSKGYINNLSVIGAENIAILLGAMSNDD